MDLVSKALVEHAEVFDEINDALFGGGATDLIEKVAFKTKDEEAKAHRRQAQIGLASNVVGITAGAVGLAAAAKDPRLQTGSKVARGIHRVGNTGQKVVENTKTGRKYLKLTRKEKVAAGLAVGAVGLQAGNLAGDFVANRVLNRATKKPEEHIKKSGPDQSEVHIMGAGGKKYKAIKSPVNELGGHAYYVLRTPEEIKQRKKLVPDVRTEKAKLAVKAAPIAVNQGKKVTTKVKERYTTDEVTKSDDVVWEGEFSKVDDDKRQVFGYASVVEINGEPVVDRQGDHISIDEVEKSAYTYVQKSRKGGNMHRRNGEDPVHVSDMIESFVITDEKIAKMGLPPETPKGWWVGFQVNDEDTWQQVKSGERTGFSIHGRGSRVEKVL